MGISGDGTINHMRRLPIFDARLSVGFAKNFIDSCFFSMAQFGGNAVSFPASAGT